MSASKVKSGIHSLLRTGSHAQQSRAASRMMVIWGDGHHHSECSSSLPLPPALDAALFDAVWSGISLGPPVLAVSPPSSLGTLSLLILAWGEEQKRLWLSELGSDENTLCYPTPIQLKSQTHTHVSYYGKNSLCPSQNQHMWQAKFGCLFPTCSSGL